MQDAIVEGMSDLKEHLKTELKIAKELETAYKKKEAHPNNYLYYK